MLMMKHCLRKMQMSKNEITGKRMVTGAASEQYKENYDRIFGKKTAPDNGNNLRQEGQHTEPSAEQLSKDPPATS